MLITGAAVFLTRLHHDGPYPMPVGGNLLAGILALLLGAALLTPWARASHRAAQLHWLILLGSPLVLFFALYSALAEMEEVIVLEAREANGQPAYLRLWVVDHDNSAWVTMPGAKSDRYQLRQSQVTMLRNGRRSCMATIRSDDRATVNDIHHRRHQKYLVQRLATSVGLFKKDAYPTTVTLRLDPCA